MVGNESKRVGGRAKEWVGGAALVAFAVPVLGILMGGIYYIPASVITRDRDPWFTVLLGVGLATSVVAIGVVAHVPWSRTWVACFCAWAILLVCRAFQKMNNLDRFGPLHMMTVMLFYMFCIAGHP